MIIFKNLFLILALYLSLGQTSLCQSFKGFDFIYDFHNNFYDSKTEMFTKDMIMDESITFKIKLTGKERKMIFKKLEEIDFWNYPGYYIFKNADSTNRIIGMQTPCFKYSITVITKGITKTVKWNTCNTGSGSKNLLYEKLTKLDSLIRNIIWQKDEYKKSPPARGGYM